MDLGLVNDISSDLLNRISDQNGDVVRNDIVVNKENVILVYNYFKLIGLNVVDSILVYFPDYFIKSFDEVVSICEGNKIRNMVSIINDDFFEVEKVFNS